jgi:hypothetical protein
LINIENLQLGSHHSAMAAAVAAASLHPDQDTDPRELEAFAERFKQRRIKLGKYKFKVGKWAEEKFAIRQFRFNSIIDAICVRVEIAPYRLKLISQENLLRMKLKKENFHLAKIEMLLLLPRSHCWGQF